jgi:hypothetical protein
MLGDDADNLLLRFSGTGKGPASAVPALLALAVKQGIVPAEDVPRMTTKFTSWLAGVGWNKCRITHSNRPSSASWNGFPWESYNIMDRECGLKHAVAWKAIEVQAEFSAPSDMVPPNYVPCFQPIWSAEDGVLDVAAACAKALKAQQNIEKGVSNVSSSNSSSRSSSSSSGSKKKRKRKSVATKKKAKKAKKKSQKMKA